jgi:hypothetical protein
LKILEEFNFLFTESVLKLVENDELLMKKASLLVALFLLLLFACTREKKASFLSTDNIRTQLFQIDPTKETRINGARGAIFSIPAGAFAGTEAVTIELKEVYAPIEILAAGLRTESNGELLESGGMFYINAKRDGKELALKKEIKGSIPADYINESMKLFKGEVEEDGNVNWVDPVPLSNELDSNRICIEAGKQLFQANCASCHAVFKKLTGPALVFTDQKYSREDYYKLIRNPAAFAKENSYFYCEIKAYGGILMTGFPTLPEKDIDCIIDYINNEAKRRPDLVMPDTSFWGSEGCKVKQSITEFPCGSDTAYINEEFQEVVQNASLNFNGNPTTTTSPFDTTIVDTTFIPAPPIRENRYNFNINTLGWYNIDVLMKNLQGITEVTIDVMTDFTDNNLVEMNLYFPEKKIQLDGNYNSTNNTFTFGADGNRIPLFIGDIAILFSIAKKDNQLFYDVHEFRIAASQSIKISLQETTQEKLNEAFEKINLDNINLDRLTKKAVVIKIPCDGTDTIIPNK